MRWVQFTLVALAFIVAEALIGGTRLLFSLPSLGLLAAAALLNLLSWRAPGRAAHAGCLIVTGVFAGWIVTRAAFSPVGYLARTDLCLLLGALLVYLLTATALTRSRPRLALVFVLLGIALAQTGLGAWQHFRGERFALFGVLEPEDFGTRASGFYICPNHLAGFLEVTALFGFALACWSRRAIWLRTLAAFGGVASLFGLALTGSRGGYLSATAGLAVFAGLSLLVIAKAGDRRAWGGALAGLALIGLVLGGFGLVLRHQQALQVRVAKLIPRDDVRTHLWDAAWQQAKLQPLTGTGAGSYEYFARQFRSVFLQADPVHAHNDWLQLLAEYGVIGLLAALVFLGAHAWRGLRDVRERLAGGFAGALPQSDRLALTLAALSAVATYAVHSFIDFNLHIPANAMLLAFAFGLLANPGGTPAPSAPADGRAGLFARLALPAAALWIAAVALPTLPAEFRAEQARAALREERFADAIAAARAGLKVDPKNPFLWRHLGQAHAALGEAAAGPAARAAFADAALAFENGLILYPRDQWLLVGLGESLDQLGRFAEAEPVFRRAVEWNPASFTVRYHYATHLRLSGRLAEAEAEYKKSLGLYYNPAALRGLELLASARGAP